MSEEDDGDQLVTKPFKFVTGRTPFVVPIQNQLLTTLTAGMLLFSYQLGSSSFEKILLFINSLALPAQICALCGINRALA